MKKILIFVFTLLIAFELCACGGAANAASSNNSPEWKVKVEGAEKTELTSADFAALKHTSFKIEANGSCCSDKNQEWDGVLLKDVLNFLGVTDYKSITLSAPDDYTKDYTQDMVNDDQTFLGAVCNGKALTAEEGFVQSIAAKQTANMWVKSVSNIKVNK